MRYLLAALLTLTLSLPSLAGVKEDYSKKYGPCISAEQIDDRHASYTYESKGFRYVVQTEDGMVQTEGVLLTDPVRQPGLKPMDTPVGEYITKHRAIEKSLVDKLDDGTVVMLLVYENGINLALRMTTDGKVLAAMVIYPKRVKA